VVPARTWHPGPRAGQHAGRRLDPSARTAPPRACRAAATGRFPARTLATRRPVHNPAGGPTRAPDPSCSGNCGPRPNPGRPVARSSRQMAVSRQRTLDAAGCRTRQPHPPAVAVLNLCRSLKSGVPWCVAVTDSAIRRLSGFARGAVALGLRVMNRNSRIAPLSERRGGSPAEQGGSLSRA